MTLTGQTIGTVIEVLATSQGNGSYKAELPLEIAESYDLKIELEDGGGGRAEILGSPLQNKILVLSGLVQAAHTHMESNAGSGKIVIHVRH